MTEAIALPVIDPRGEACDDLLALDPAVLARARFAIVHDLVAFAEDRVSAWLLSRGKTPGDAEVEGFRLLGLHRQAAQGDASFNACRETCRELIYQTNMVKAAADDAEAARHVRLAIMVARHLALFINGKLEVAGLGEFCCSAKGIRSEDAAAHQGQDFDTTMATP
jgi:hypothetical protein